LTILLLASKKIIRRLLGRNTGKDNIAVDRRLRKCKRRFCVAEVEKAM